MSIRAKIIGCFVFILVLFGGVSFYQHSRTQKTTTHLALVNELFLPLSRHVAQLQSGAQGLAEDVRRFYFNAGATAEDSTLSRMVRDLYPYLIRKNFSAAEALLLKPLAASHSPLVNELSGLLVPVDGRTACRITRRAPRKLDRR